MTWTARSSLALAFGLTVVMLVASCAPYRGVRNQKQAPGSEMISTSAGSSGGVTVLWPRVYPSGQTQAMAYVAQPLQHRLSAIIRRIHPQRDSDVRPPPQRACPAGGCKGFSAGVVLLTRGDQCAAIVTIAKPGESPQVMVRWGGDVELKTSYVAFREPPETQLVVNGWVPCAQLTQKLDHTDAVERAVRNLIR